MKKKNTKSTTQTSSKPSLTASKLSGSSRWNVDTIVFAILMATMLISPYFRGLFFAENYLAFHLICTALFIALLVKRWFIGVGQGDQSTTWLHDRPIDYLFWLLPLAYLISMIGAVEPGLARNEFLKNFNYALIAMMIIMTAKTRAHQQITLIVFFLTCIWVSLFGHGVMFGVWEFTDGMTGTRLSSVFQYPNTLASFVGAGCLLGLFLLLHYVVDEDQKMASAKFYQWIAPIYLIGSTFLFSAMLHTGSRGGWLVFFVVFVFSLIVVPLRQKLFYFIFSAISIGAGGYLYTLTNRLAGAVREYEAELTKNVVVAKKVAEQVGSSSSETLVADPGTLIDPQFIIDYSPYVIKIALLTLGVYVIGLVCVRLYKWMIQEPRRFRIRQWSMAVIVILGTVIAIILAPSILSETANIDALENIWQRFTTLKEIESTDTDSLRFTFNRDAMEIVKDYPIFGAGGGAWHGLFQKYQTHPYWSTQAHTYYMQLATETGIFGLFSLIALLIGVIIVFYLVIRRADQLTKVQLWGIAVTLLMLLAHNTADFNMAYAIYGGFIWMFFGIIVSHLRVDSESLTEYEPYKLTTPIWKIGQYDRNKISPSIFAVSNLVITTLVVIVIFFINVQPLNAISNYMKSSEFNEQEQTAKSFEAIRTAYRADAKNVDIIIYYTKFLNEIIITEPNEHIKQQYSQELFSILAKATKQFPYNTRIKNQLIDMYFTHGYSVDAVNELPKLLKIAPYTPSYYDRTVEYSYRIGQLLSEQGGAKNQELAQKYWQQGIDAYEQYQRLYTDAVEQKKPNEYQFRIQKATNLYAAIIYYSLSKQETANKILQLLIADNSSLKELSISMQKAFESKSISDEVIQEWLEKLL